MLLALHITEASLVVYDKNSFLAYKLKSLPDLKRRTCNIFCNCAQLSREKSDSNLSSIFGCVCWFSRRGPSNILYNYVVIGDEKVVSMVRHTLNHLLASRVVHLTMLCTHHWRLVLKYKWHKKM